MTDHSDIAAAAVAERLFVSGIVEDGDRSIALLSPDEPDYWPHFQASEEARDGGPNPLDRWSTRVITRMADTLGGTALFPFEGPPWHPFPTWAVASGEAWHAPTGLIVHRRAGLFASYRGAIAFDAGLNSVTATSPCPTCAQPCVTACPVDAFVGGGYDVPRCKAFLDTNEGQDCRTNGCRVRRACPVGQDRRLPAQSAFHMRSFHPDAT